MLTGFPSTAGQAPRVRRPGGLWLLSAREDFVRSLLQTACPVCSQVASLAGLCWSPLNGVALGPRHRDPWIVGFLTMGSQCFKNHPAFSFKGFSKIYDHPETIESEPSLNTHSFSCSFSITVFSVTRLCYVVHYFLKPTERKRDRIFCSREVPACFCYAGSLRQGPGFCPEPVPSLPRERDRASEPSPTRRPVRDTPVLTYTPPSARVRTTLTVTAALQQTFSVDRDRDRDRAEPLADALFNPESRPWTWALPSRVYRRRLRPRKVKLPRSRSQQPCGQERILV